MVISHRLKPLCVASASPPLVPLVGHHFASSAFPAPQFWESCMETSLIVQPRTALLTASAEPILTQLCHWICLPLLPIVATVCSDCFLKAKIYFKKQSAVLKNMSSVIKFGFKPQLPLNSLDLWQSKQASQASICSF